MQEEQLGRYIKYLKETSKTKNKKLLYLTLANEFDNDSHCNEDYSPGIGISQRERKFLKSQGVKTVEDIKLYKHITYSNDILDWLANAQKEAVSLPRIREVIEQYIQIIRELTNKPEDMVMNEIKDYIKKDKEHYNALTECYNAYNNIRAVKEKSGVFRFYRRRRQRIDAHKGYISSACRGADGGVYVKSFRSHGRFYIIPFACN